MDYKKFEKKSSIPRRLQTKQSLKLILNYFSSRMVSEAFVNAHMENS